MSKTEVVQFVEHDAKPAEGIKITLEDSIAGRVGEVGFSVPEFYSWTQSRGLLDPENHPLIINIKERSVRDIKGRPSSNGAFYMDAGIANIDLYVARRIGVYDLFQDKHDTEYREQVFNEALNRTFAHETEHYIEVSNGHYLQDVRGEFILQEMVSFAVFSAFETPRSDEQLSSKIHSLKELYDSADTSELELALPHELRAREAGEIHSQLDNPIIWLTLNPPPMPKS